MKTFIIKRIDMIAIIGVFLLVFLVAMFMSGCNGIPEPQQDNTIILHVIGRPDEHTVWLWEENTEKQYVFSVENAYNECYDLGTVIYVNRKYPE